MVFSYPEIDRVKGTKHFVSFLLRRNTTYNWHWSNRGVIIFLGGDQIVPVIIAKRLGYKTLVYAEYQARWHAFIDKFAVMKPEVATKIAPKYAGKFTIVGNLMAEVSPNETLQPYSSRELSGIFLASKIANLSHELPLTLLITEYIHVKRPQVDFILPIAPTLNLETLINAASHEKNPLVKVFGSSAAELLYSQLSSRLKTTNGLAIELITTYPAYEALSQCSISLPTIGANNAELGCLA